MHKHLLQQKLQQKVHIVYYLFFVRHIWFWENKWTSPLKCNIYFSLLYHNLKFVVQNCALCYESVKEYVITTTIVFTCETISLLIKYALVFKVVTFIFAIFYVTLFDVTLIHIVLTVWSWTIPILYYLMLRYFQFCTISNLYHLMLYYFNDVLFDVTLFSCCTISVLKLRNIKRRNMETLHHCTTSMLHFLMLRYFNIALFSCCTI